jgi:cupin domain
MERKSIKTSPDETRTFDKGKLQIANLGGVTIGQYTLQPGWKWSTSVKPLVGTNSCQQMHTGYIISGRMRVRMDDGSETECGPGDAAVIPPGHDAWVVGNEPCVGIDFTGSKTFAKS